MPTILIAVAVMMATRVLPAAVVQSPGCAEDPRNDAKQETKRDLAVDFLQEVNSAQARLWQERRTFVSLGEAVTPDRTPFGFIPRLTFDQWSYQISLKDALDVCGLSFFSDQDGVVYEGHPLPRDRRLRSPLP